MEGRRKAKNGETTRKFLEYLLEHGPKTVAELERLPFFGGVRTRVGKLVQQGRIELVDVVNPFSGRKYARCLLRAYRAVPGCETGPLKRGGSGPSGDNLTYRERWQMKVKEKRRLSRIEQARVLLEESGYLVSKRSEG